MTTLVKSLGLAFWLLAGSSACTEKVSIARDFPEPSAGFGGADAGVPPMSGNTGLDAGTPECRVTTCQGKIYACGDCLDNDGDGVADALDGQCTGPCDNTEDSYFSGIPGANNAPCREDCYFDQDTGAGNDHCYWSQQCDPLAIAPDYSPSGDERCAYDPASKVPGTAASCAELQATQSPTCLDYCGPLTPNGCDAFGCCELPSGSKRFVWLGSNLQGSGTCTEETLADPSACRPCTPVASSFNACDECEVCVGRVAPAASCAGATPRCATATVPCGQPGEEGCGAGEYCVTGCCSPAPK